MKLYVPTAANYHAMKSSVTDSSTFKRHAFSNEIICIAFQALAEVYVLIRERSTVVIIFLAIIYVSRMQLHGSKHDCVYLLTEQCCSLAPESNFPKRQCERCRVIIGH